MTDGTRAGVAAGRLPLGSERGPDAAGVLTAYVLCLLVIPSPMVFTAMGQVGGPSTLLALACFIWWAWDRVHEADGRVDVQRTSWVRSAALINLVVVLIVYAHSAGLAIPAGERSPADAGLVRTLGWTGLVCVAVDGLSSRERLWVLARRIALVMGAISVLTAVQIATGQVWVDRLSLPGLSDANGLVLIQRGAVLRPSGTSTHPIELSAVMAMAMPLVIAVAAREVRRPWLMRCIALALPAVLLLNGSRTAVVCGLVAFVVLFAGFGRRARLVAAGGFLVIVTGMFVALPGFIGSITGLFKGASSDPSVASRTDSYAVVFEYWNHHPWLGRGVGTFLPEYWILDNQYLNLLLGGGLIGLGAQLLLFASAIASAGSAGRMASDPHDRLLAFALLAGVCAGAVSWALFDVSAFAQAAGLLALLIGMSGAILRILSAERDDETTPSHGSLR